MNTTNKILLPLAIVAVVAAAFYLLTPPKSENIAEVNNNLSDSAEVAPLTDEEIINENAATEVVYTEADRAIFAAYLGENISILSESPEVLGGTFFVTNYSWLDNNTAVVSYEDGHNAYQAETKLSYSDNNVVVDYFNVLGSMNLDAIDEPAADQNIEINQGTNNPIDHELLIEEPAPIQ